MTPVPLHVATDADAPANTETIAERIRRLQAEAKQLAAEHVRSLIAKMVEVEEIAAEIADGGEAYSPGVRDLASRLVEDIEARRATLDAVMSRTM